MVFPEEKIFTSTEQKISKVFFLLMSICTVGVLYSVPSGVVEWFGTPYQLYRVLSIWPPWMAPHQQMGALYSTIFPTDGDASENEDYDPHAHRTIQKPTNNWETLIHLLKCSLGTGILAMPQGYTNSGLAMGMIFTVVVGIIITHCLHLLVQGQYRACRRVRKAELSYPESFKIAIHAGSPRVAWMAKPGAFLVDLFLIVYQLGICCCYIVFMSSNIKKMVDPTHIISIEGWMGIIFLPLILINLIPNLKILAPFSAVANVFTLIGLIIILYYLLSGKKSQDKLDWWGSPETFPLFFGTVMFALTSPGVVVAIENNMKSPKKFGGYFGMLNIGMTIITLLYMLIGAIGYVYCVSSCSDAITLDLPAGAGSIVVMVMMVLAIFISYVLHCYVPVEVIWKGYLLPWLEESNWTSHLKFWESLLRVVLCIITFIVAIAIPRLGLFISLFGAFCLSALGICFPALMEACLVYKMRHKNRGVIFKDAILIIIGLIGLVAGTYSSVLAIIKSFA